jgi:hypothetical protein
MGLMFSPLCQKSDGEAGSGSNRLATISNSLLRIGFYIPLAVVVAFVFEKGLLRLIDPIFFDGTKVSHFKFLQDQYEFLQSKHPVDIVSPGDFHLFEMFICMASIVSLLRLLTGVGSRPVLLSSRTKLDNLKSRGMTTSSAIGSCLFGASVAILLSLNFKLISSSQVLFLMDQSPRIFVAFIAFIFCGGVIFFAEGLLLLTSIVCVRGRGQLT